MEANSNAFLMISRLHVFMVLLNKNAGPQQFLKTLSTPKQVHVNVCNARWCDDKIKTVEDEWC